MPIERLLTQLGYSPPLALAAAEAGQAARNRNHHRVASIRLAVIEVPLTAWACSCNCRGCRRAGRCRDRPYRTDGRRVGFISDQLSISARSCAGRRRTWMQTKLSRVDAANAVMSRSRKSSRPSGRGDPAAEGITLLVAAEALTLAAQAGRGNQGEHSRRGHLVHEKRPSGRRAPTAAGDRTPATSSPRQAEAAHRRGRGSRPAKREGGLPAMDLPKPGRSRSRTGTSSPRRPEPAGGRGEVTGGRRTPPFAGPRVAEVACPPSGSPSGAEMGYAPRAGYAIPRRLRHRPTTPSTPGTVNHHRGRHAARPGRVWWCSA